jgi:hypothetical protein
MPVGAPGSHKSGRVQEDSGDRQPDSGDPIVRDGMGALWKRGPWGNYDPAAYTERVHVGNSLPKDARATILPGGFRRATSCFYPEWQRMTKDKVRRLEKGNKF